MLACRGDSGQGMVARRVLLPCNRNPREDNRDGQAALAALQALPMEHDPSIAKCLSV